LGNAPAVGKPGWLYSVFHRLSSLLSAEPSPLQSSVLGIPEQPPPRHGGGLRHAMVSTSGSVGWKWTHDNQTAKMVIGDTDDHLKTRDWMMASGSQTPPAL